MRRKKDSLGLSQALLFGTMFYVVIGLDWMPMGSPHAFAQNTALPFRPIGSQSAVDRFTTNSQRREDAASSQYHETGYQPMPLSGNRDVQIRQVAMQSGGFELPPSDYSPPPLNTPPPLLPGQSRPPAQMQPQSTGPLPPTPSLQAAPLSNPPQFSPPPNYNQQSNAPAPPRTLPNSMATGPTYSAPPMADYQPVVPPQLSNGGFATMSDCRLITPPSSYTAMSPYGTPCGNVAPAGYADPYAPPPAQTYAPVVVPPYAAPPSAVAIGSAAPVGSLVTFGQETYLVQVGQGLWGQPVAYVPGQRFRNWLRYFSF